MINKYLNRYTISAFLIILAIFIATIYIITIYKFTPPRESTTIKSTATIKDLDSVITDPSTRRNSLNIIDIYIKKYYKNPENNFEIDRSTIQFEAPNENDIETASFIFKVKDGNNINNVTLKIEGTRNIYYRVTLIDNSDKNKSYSSVFSLLPEKNDNQEFINNNQNNPDVDYSNYD